MKQQVYVKNEGRRQKLAWQVNIERTVPSEPMPARHCGGVYVTPKLSWTQYGQAAGSETTCVVVGSLLLICTKHSVQMAWSQQREWLIFGG